MNMFSTKCVYEATTEENVAGEQNGEHEEVNYPCGQCGKHFSQKGKMDKHRRVVHEGVKYPCGQCGKHFSSKGDVTKHQRGVHEGVK